MFFCAEIDTFSGAFIDGSNAESIADVVMPLTFGDYDSTFIKWGVSTTVLKPSYYFIMPESLTVNN